MTKEEFLGMDTIVQDIRESNEVLALYHELMEKVATYLEHFGEVLEINECHLRPVTPWGAVAPDGTVHTTEITEKTG